MIRETDQSILFITTTNLAVNPRLLKEIKAAKELYKIHLVGINLNNWSNNLNENIAKGLNIPSHFISISSKYYRAFAAIIKSIAKALLFVFPGSLLLNSIFIDKRTIALIRYLSKLHGNYSLIIAHNPGALYPAYYFSKKKSIPFAFDIEDFHPGESDNEKNIRSITRLMKNLLPLAKYISHASPLIKEHTEKLLNNSHQISVLINNSFATEEFVNLKQRVDQNNPSEKIKFVWFSQNIAHGRGLELIINTLKNLQDTIELHLIGNLYIAFYDEWIKPYKRFIHIHKPLTQVDLHKKLAEFHVGLAIEMNASNLNRQLCLTNKLFAYTQAGLYSIITNTPAQEKFHKKNQWCGILCQQDTEGLIEAVKKIINNRTTILNDSFSRYKLAQKLSWDHEKEKLINTWNKILYEKNE